MKKNVVSVTLLVAALVLSGCVSTPKPKVSQLDDDKMSCEAIKKEFADLDRYEEQADENKSVNTQNVLAAVFFWPAVVSTVMSADEAQKAVEKRRLKLTELSHAKGC